MTTDFRALCAELEDAYAWCIEEYMTAPAEEDTLIQRARAALRAKPPTLNIIALQMLDTIERDAHYIPEITDTIRTALKALPNDN